MSVLRAQPGWFVAEENNSADSDDNNDDHDGNDEDDGDDVLTTQKTITIINQKSTTVGF